MSNSAMLASTPSAALHSRPWESRINFYDWFRFLTPTKKKARACSNGAVTLCLPLSHRCAAALAERENASSASPKQFLVMFGWNANKC